jgi:ABC-2 type transport system ATP-binding protein
MSGHALALRGLGKDYGPRQAVGAIDLEVVRGECLGLLGPNGAGKTTTISMACGVVTPSRGTVAIGDIDLRSRPFEAKAKLGLVPQELAIYEDLTATQNLRYFGALYGLSGSTLDERVAWALEAVKLADRASEPAKQYSGGMKRRLNLAAGLVHRPELLVLDEPTVGVDPQSRNHIFETVRALHASGMTIVYTSHYMEEVEAICDRVAIMDGGAIIATGTIAELIAAHAGKGIEIALAGTPEVIAAAAAAAAAHGTIERKHHTLRVIATAVLAPLITAIEDAGATITRIESHEASLETAFLKLTGKTLRDEAG